MSHRILVATYDAEENLLAGTRAVRARGIRIRDAYTPYAVHGLDQAMGLAPSRLTWACGVFGLSAAIFMTWFQYWTSAVDWPINIGGKPWNSLPAFAPVIFESMVLCAGLGTVLAFLLIAKLRPWKTPELVVDGVTNDRFALVIEHAGAERDLEEMRQILAASKPVAIDERVGREEWERAARAGRELNDRSWLGLGNILLLVVLIILIGATVFAPRDFSRPNWEIFSEMVRTPAYSAFAENSNFPHRASRQMPVSSTIPRGRMPLHYEATEEGNLAAGLELENAFEADDPDALERGQYVFQRYCVVCHGGSGNGDGPVAVRGFPPPPSFATGKSREMADGGLFHILTYGRGNMPSHAGLVSRDDRWKVILHVRRLAQQAEPSVPGENSESPESGSPNAEAATPVDAEGDAS